jgi:hypothetical protein
VASPRSVFSAASFRSVHELIAAYANDHNDSPRPFVWKARAEDILEKPGRAGLALNKTATA